MKLLERFFRTALDVADKKGNENQQIDMQGVVAVTAQSAGELGDLLTGTRKRKDHPHHTIPDLTNAVVDGIKTITEVRSEIEGKK